MIKNNFTTLSEVVEYFHNKGYKYLFSFGDKKETPADWTIEESYHFEGNGDTVSDSIVYLLKKKDNSNKGILVNAHNIYSSGKITQFIECIDKSI